MEHNGLGAHCLESTPALAYDDASSVLDWLADSAPLSDDYEDLPRRYKASMIDAQSLPPVDHSENLLPYRGAAVLVSHAELEAGEIYRKWQVTSQRLYEARCASLKAAEDEMAGGFLVFVSRGRPLREELAPDVHHYVWHLSELQKLQAVLTQQIEDVADVEEDFYPEVLEQFVHRGEGYESDVLDLFYCVYFPIVCYRQSAQAQCATPHWPQLDQLQSDASQFIDQNFNSFCEFFSNDHLPVWMRRQYNTLRQWLDSNQLLLDEFIMWCNYLISPNLELHAPTYALGEALLRAMTIQSIVTDKRVHAISTPFGWFEDRLLTAHDLVSTGSAAETTDVEEEADELDSAAFLTKDLLSEEQDFGGL